MPAGVLTAAAALMRAKISRAGLGRSIRSLRALKPRAQSPKPTLRSSHMRRYLVRAAVIVLGLVLVLGTSPDVWARAQLRASLPQLDGTLRVAGLSAPVTDRTGRARHSDRSWRVARTMSPAPSASCTRRSGSSRWTSSRRRAAGELAALVGAACARGRSRDPAASLPRRAPSARSRHGARRRARVLDAYAAGVNTGLTSLGAAPFEYLLLRQDPRPWLPEDSLLVVLSMFITLQDYTGSYESTLATMSDLMPKPMVDLLVPDGTEWDSPDRGHSFSVPPIPGPDVYDLRARRSGKKERIVLPPAAAGDLTFHLALGVGPWALGVDERPQRERGRQQQLGDCRAADADGAPLVANDMHLTVRVPNTWYRASLEWPDPSSPSGPLRLIGITLPGVPALVVGSNTHVAWGFTNTYADWSDMVLLDVDPQDPTSLSHAGRLADLRTPRRGDRGCRRTTRASRGVVDDLGSGGRARSSRPARARFAGSRTTSNASPSHRPRSRPRTPWTRPSTR